MALNALIIALDRSPDVEALEQALRRRGMLVAELPAEGDVGAICRQLGLSPAQCAAVTDHPAVADACRRSGIVCIGLSSGGSACEQLIGAGARVVYRDAAELLDRLDEAFEAASPGPARLTQQMLESLMHQALAAAEEGLAHGEAPIGCVLARGDGSVIARAHNEQNRTQNKAAHAEIVAFTRAAGKVPLQARDLLMVSTLEPCVMCTGAAMVCAVDTIIFGLRAPADSGTMRVRPPTSPESQMPRIIGDILAEQSLRLFQRWLAIHHDDEQAKYVKQLLALHGVQT
jgi:tRNA(adenine34) deaminase